MLQPQQAVLYILYALILFWQGVRYFGVACSVTSYGSTPYRQPLSITLCRWNEQVDGSAGGGEQLATIITRKPGPGNWAVDFQVTFRKPPDVHITSLRDLSTFNDCFVIFLKLLMQVLDEGSKGSSHLQ